MQMNKTYITLIACALINTYAQDKTNAIKYDSRSSTKIIQTYRFKLQSGNTLSLLYYSQQDKNVFKTKNNRTTTRKEKEQEQEETPVSGQDEKHQ